MKLYVEKTTELFHFRVSILDDIAQGRDGMALSTEDLGEKYDEAHVSIIFVRSVNQFISANLEDHLWSAKHPFGIKDELNRSKICATK